MTRRRFRTLVAVLMVLMLVAAACGDDSSDEGGGGSSDPADTDGGSDTASPTGGYPSCPETEGAVIGYSEPLPDPNFALIEGVMQSELGNAGATLQPVNANLDPSKQISDIDTLVSGGIDVLVVNPVDPTAVQDTLSSLDIPVVVQDTQAGGPYFTNVTADVETAAEAGAQALFDEGGTDPVAVIEGPPFAEVLVREAEAFAAAADELGLNIVDTQVNQTITPDAAAEIANGFKTEYGDELAGIWTFNDTSAVGVASTFDASYSPYLVSINGQPEAIPLLEDGAIDVTYDLQQDMIGRALSYAALAAVCGEEVPEDIWVHSEPLTTDTAGEWVNPEERGAESIDVTLEEGDDERTFLVEA